MIDRGFCPFVQKVLNAQTAGAIGVIVANNTTPGLPGMGGTSVAVTIPSLGVTQELGNAMKANLPSPGVTVSLTTDPTLPLAGTRFDCVRMFAPTPVQSGSSVSHFHSDAFPNLRMEPALTGTIFDCVGLTADLFRDFGWTVAGDDVYFAENFEDRPCAFAP